MYHYRIYCMDVVSDIELISLVKGNGNPDPNNSITIKEGVLPDRVRPEEECFCYVDEKESYLSNSYCFLYVTDGNTIIYEKRPGKDQSNLTAYILGWGMSMLCFERNSPVIHCSAVYNEKGAFLISGRSGSGKSTLTTSLLESGLKFLADDTSAVSFTEKEALAHPCFPHRKLCRDVVVEKNLNPEELIYIDEDKDKFLVPWTEFFPDYPIRVKALIFIEHASNDDSEVKVREVTGFTKVNYFYQALFIEPLLDKHNHNDYTFQMCLKLAGLIPIYAVTRPKNIDSRTAVFDKVNDLINSI